MSDWAQGILSELREYYISRDGWQNTFYDLLDSDDLWGDKVEKHKQLMKWSKIMRPDANASVSSGLSKRARIHANKIENGIQINRRKRERTKRYEEEMNSRGVHGNGYK
jgi:hypothetical protein